MTPRERNTKFYTTALKQMSCVLPNIQKGIDFDPPVPIKSENAGNKNHIKNYSFLFTGNIIDTKPTGVTMNNDRMTLDEDNLTYNLWTFGNIRILIRCKIHGLIPDSNSSLVSCTDIPPTHNFFSTFRIIYI